MSRARVNWKSIQYKISKSKKLNQSLEEAGRKKFKIAKRRLMSRFEAHAVTKEIAGGSSSKNISGSLGGYGNLFSLIGFPEGADPLSAVKSLLNASIRIKANRARASQKIINKNFSVKIPTIKDFAAIGKMPYEGGNSWIEMIEMGISNFSSYMNKRSPASRSGGGIQIKGKIKMSGSTPTPYMTELLNSFRKELMRK